MKGAKQATDPMQRSVFDSGARARATDPTTSHEAAQRVTNMRASQARVLAMFKLYGDLYDAQLIQYLHDAERAAGMKPMSPSGVRSRRNELSKPNMDRLDEIAHEMTYVTGAEDPGTSFTYAEHSGVEQVALRARLLTEGVKSPLWDTGKRAHVDGRNVIVWGIAR